MPTAPDELPIERYLEEIAAGLGRSGVMLLRAETGAGKTTRLPLALLDAHWLKAQRIVMLEPRRLAARHAASFMAAQLGDPVGKRIGYAVRHDSRFHARTRLLVVTQGVFLRQLQDDPGLEGVGLVILDEFHERTLEGDLALALCRQSRTLLRPDLRLLIMSATLDQPALAKGMPKAAACNVPGRAYPVAIEYRGGDSQAALRQSVAEAVAREVREQAADGRRGILAFLPGAAEIRRAMAMLESREADISPLYSALPWAEQQRALQLRNTGRTRIILATNIAETSLTIDGIDTVIDSGLVRRNVFSPRTGMSRLETGVIARASATQRTGRAGRSGPGRAIRLWSEAFERGMAPTDPPEIETADLSALALELASWGVRDADELDWVTRPPAGPLAAARALLQQLGALDEDNRITEQGRAMGRWPLHPRLAAMIEASGPADRSSAVALAALLDSDGATLPRDVVDLAMALQALTRSHAGSELRRNHARLRRQAGLTDKPFDPVAAGAVAGRCLAAAFPDRIAMRRQPGSEMLKLSNGRGARLPAGAFPATINSLVVAELDDRGSDALVRLAAALPDGDLAGLVARRGEKARHVRCDFANGQLLAEEIERIGELVLIRRNLADPDPVLIENALLEAILASDLEWLPWSAASWQWLDRLAFLHLQAPMTWPDLTREQLKATAQDWLMPYLAGMRCRADLERLNLCAMLDAALAARCGKTAIDELHRLSPPGWQSPLNRRIAIDYQPETPRLSLPLQEVLGLDQHPTIMNGTVPLVVELLSPAGRPVQSTNDLPGFWRGSYADIRKEMRGRYPRHPWPEQPAKARPWRPGMRRDG